MGRGHRYGRCPLAFVGILIIEQGLAELQQLLHALVACGEYGTLFLVLVSKARPE
jgi:hypothetical protein